MMKERAEKSKYEITGIETTSEIMTGRGGVLLYKKYLDRVGICRTLGEAFGSLRKSSKGLDVNSLFEQTLCWFYDGTSRHISYFDQLKEDEGYAGVIETPQKLMASSHQMKRFFGSYTKVCGKQFRKALKELFVWRLLLERPETICLTVDFTTENFLKA